MNYLADRFRREFTDATVRIFAMDEEPLMLVAGAGD
jgi:hypothetical protein